MNSHQSCLLYFVYTDSEMDAFISGLLVEAVHFLRFPRAKGDQVIHCLVGEGQLLKYGMIRGKLSEMHSQHVKFLACPA